MIRKSEDRNEKIESRRQENYIFLIFFIILFFFPGNSLSYDIQTREFEKQIIKEKGHLKKVEKDIQKKTQTIDKLRKEEKTVAFSLEEIEKELVKNKNSIWQLKKEMEVKNKEIKKTKEKISEASYKLNIYKKDLSYFLQNMYKYKNRGYLEYILTAEDWGDFIKRYKFLTILAVNYAETVRNIEYQKRIISNENKILIHCFEKLKILKINKDKIYQEELQKEERKKRLLSKIENDKNLYLNQIECLKESSLRIRKLIESLEIQKKKREEVSILAKAKFQTGQGSLEWPVNSRNILRSFGKSKHEKFDAIIFNKGIDIGVKQKTNVLCIKAGQVVFADWFRGYGQMVMVDHGGGYYTLYSNLDHILTSKGSIINGRSPVGVVREESYLHFEIRINGNPVDPLLWLGG